MRGGRRWVLGGAAEERVTAGGAGADGVQTKEQRWHLFGGLDAMTTHSDCQSRPWCQAHERSVQLAVGGWVRKGLCGLGGEGLDEVADEAAPGVGGGVSGGGDDAGVGHQDQGHVLVGEVVAESAGGFRAFEQVGQRVGGSVAVLLEGFGGGERQGEDVGEAAVVGLHLADAFDVGAEAVPGVGVGEGVVDGLRIGVHLVAKVAAIRSSRVGKRRNRVATPTPARRAISLVEASRPCSANTSRAASMTLSRLRSASARRPRPLAGVCPRPGRAS